jgi:hypothetical protein
MFSELKLKRGMSSEVTLLTDKFNSIENMGALYNKVRISAEYMRPFLMINCKIMQA